MPTSAICRNRCSATSIRKSQVPLLTVYHAATFYRSFSLTPPRQARDSRMPGHGLPCAPGPRACSMALKERLEIDPGQTTKDRKFTLRR